MSKKGYTEEGSEDLKIRVILTSTNVKSLETGIN